MCWDSVCYTVLNLETYTKKLFWKIKEIRLFTCYLVIYSVYANIKRPTKKMSKKRKIYVNKNALKRSSLWLGKLFDPNLWIHGDKNNVIILEILKH